MRAKVTDNLMFDKMVKARTQLLINSDFGLVANLVMMLDLVEDTKINTAATNGEIIKYNPKYIAPLSLEETKGLLGHEAYHCVLLHHTRRGMRDPKFWNIAGDIVINLMLLEIGMRLPNGALIEPKFKGLSTEQVYYMITSQINKEEQQELKDKHDKGNFGDFEEANGTSSSSDKENEESDNKETGKSDSNNKESGSADSGSNEEKTNTGSSSGSGNDEENESGSTGSEKEMDKSEKNSTTDETKEKNNGFTDSDGENKDRDSSEDDKKLGTQNVSEQESKWSVGSKIAIQVATKMGGNLEGRGYGSLLRAIQNVVEPTVDWKTALQMFADRVCKNEYSWSKPNRRMINRGLYLPSKSGRDLGTIIVVIDTSGSVGQKDLDQIASELNEIRSIYRCKIIVIYVDAAVQRVEEYEQFDELELVPYGGGGTNFVPAFRYLENNSDEIEPTCLLYFTDGICSSFPEEPEFPVLWIGTRTFNPPFGDFIQMDFSA